MLSPAHVHTNMAENKPVRHVAKWSAVVGILLLIALVVNRNTSTSTGVKPQQFESSFLSTRDGTSVAGDALSAASLTGVYYVPGRPSQCLIIRARTSLAQYSVGFEVEPSDGMASVFVAAFGTVLKTNPCSGHMYIFKSATNRGVAEFVYIATSQSIIIDRRTYWRRPSKAPWTCQTGFSKPIALQPGSTTTHCQWMAWNKKTGGFVFYYNPNNGLVGGGGVFDATTNTGIAVGIFANGVLDGAWDMARQTIANVTTWSVTRPGDSKPTVVWGEVSKCVHFPYTTVTQPLSPSPPTTTQIPQTTLPPEQCSLGSVHCVNGNMKTSCAQTRTCQKAQSSTAYFGSCAQQVRNMFGGGWKLVRRVGPSNRGWHPATDQLRGTESYGSPLASDTADGTFSEKWSPASFNQFLLMTGDCASWVITSRNSLLSGWYDNQARVACATSVIPNTKSQPKWYHRQANLEDPLVVAAVDYTFGTIYGVVVYVENNSQRVVNELTVHNGANVYIRSKTTVDSDGC